MPCGTYMAGSRLNQENNDACTCYNCKKPGHIRAKCPDLKKKKGSSGTKHSDAKKKWYNTNKDNKTTMTRDVKTFHWCGTCSYGQGRWTERHEPKDCPYKSANATRASETEAVDADGSGCSKRKTVSSAILQFHYHTTTRIHR